MERLLPFVIADSEKCTGCRVCEIACHAYHHVVGKTIGTVIEPIVPKLYVQRNGRGAAPVQCHQCEGAPCAWACVPQAIYFDRGRVMVDTTRCDSCRDCIEACPFGAIQLVPDGETSLVGNKCDLCLGREQGPVCVAQCPSQALRLINPPKEKRTKNRQAAENGKYLVRK